MKNLLLFFVLVLLIPATLFSQVKINEVVYNPLTGGDMIELKNFGSSAVDVTNWWFCALGSYTRISSMTEINGLDKNIPAGDIIALSGRTLGNTSDLGLYNDGVQNGVDSEFVQPSLMEDFVQWGAGGLTRENVAVSKGIWTGGDFVATVAQGHSIEYDGDGNDVSDWADAATPTIGAENSNVTSVEDAAGIPENFSLEQNFPNPFNPSTIINYTIPQSANLINTRLEIFKLLGQKVRTLVNTRQASGTHAVHWNGTNDSGKLLASGLYVYRLQAAEFVDMKKMLFMK